MTEQRIYRRRTSIRPFGDVVHADVEDYQHRFSLMLRHDGQRILAVEGESLRVPWAICPGAVSVLPRLVGIELDASPFVMMRRFDLAQQCTHLADLACVAGAGVARGEGARLYDMTVAVTPWGEPDRRLCEVRRDGVLRYRWVLADGLIQEPDAFAGEAPGRAPRWAPQRETDPVGLEALFVAMRTPMVANGLRYEDVDAFRHAADSRVGRNACFSLQDERIEHAVRALGQVRQFDTQDELLAGLAPTFGESE